MALQLCAALQQLLLTIVIEVCCSTETSACPVGAEEPMGACALMNAQSGWCTGHCRCHVSSSKTLLQEHWQCRSNVHSHTHILVPRHLWASSTLGSLHLQAQNTTLATIIVSVAQQLQGEQTSVAA